MDIDPHNLGDPVFKIDQVITMSDLEAIMEGFIYRFHETRWWEFNERRQLKFAVYTTKGIMNWLRDGKKVVTV